MFIFCFFFYFSDFLYNSICCGYHDAIQKGTYSICLYTEVDKTYTGCNQGPVVQSVVSLTSSLRVILLTVLVDSIYNFLIFFAEKNVSSFCTAKATHIFSAKNLSIFAYHSM